VKPGRRIAVALVAAWLLLPAAEAAPEGAALYLQHCVVCHQADGTGAAGVAPSLLGAHWARLGADRSYLPAVVLNGLFGPIKLAGGQAFSGNMPGFAPTLDDTSVAAVANHVRKLQGADNSPGYSADDIKAVRQQPGSPTASRQKRARLFDG
jgi:mono/diheme cytochrome c family protein